MNQTKLNFWLGLFYAGYQNAYMSVIPLFAGNWNERIELVLPNVGRLCLYQGFVDDDSGSQIPNFKVFYSFTSDMKTRTRIQSEPELSMAIDLIYTTKRYFESAKSEQKKPDLIIDTVMKNAKLMEKMHANLMAHKKSRIFDVYR